MTKVPTFSSVEEAEAWLSSPDAMAAWFKGDGKPLASDDEGYGREMTALVNHTVRAVWWSEDIVTFVTDAGTASYEVEGDCCSTSYFHDLIGLEKLLSGPVVSVNQVPLLESDVTLTCACCKNGEVVAAYGYQIVVEHPVWGEVTCALSFRNDSNGYYGGMMRRSGCKVTSDQVRLTGDKIPS